MESQRKNFLTKSWFKTLKEAGVFCRVGTAWPICGVEIKRRNVPQHKTEDPGSYIDFCLYNPRRLLLSSWKWQTSCGLILHETELWEARWLLGSPVHTQPPSVFFCNILSAASLLLYCISGLWWNTPFQATSLLYCCVSTSGASLDVKSAKHYRGDAVINLWKLERTDDGLLSSLSNLFIDDKCSPNDL